MEISSLADFYLLFFSVVMGPTQLHPHKVILNKLASHMDSRVTVATGSQQILLDIAKVVTAHLMARHRAVSTLILFLNFITT